MLLIQIEDMMNVVLPSSLFVLADFKSLPVGVRIKVPICFPSRANSSMGMEDLQLEKHWLNG